MCKTLEFIPRETIFILFLLASDVAQRNTSDREIKLRSSNVNYSLGYVVASD